MTVKYGKLYAKDSSGNVVQIIPESQTIEEYQGATSTTAGSPGLVPGALSSEKDNFLKGDGTWQGAVTIDTEQTITGLKTVDKNILGTVQTLSGSQIDVTSASFFKKTLSANTIFTFTGTPANKTAIFTLIIENNGGYEITFPNNVTWYPYAPDTAIESGMFTFVTIDGGTTWTCNLNSVFFGATASANGVEGLVPAPKIADKDKFLKGDGTWAEVDISNMVTTDTNQTITGQKTFNSTIFGKTVALSGNEINVTDGTIFTKTITTDTTFTFTGVPTNAVATFSLVLTNGGAYTVTWPNNVLFSEGIEPELQTSGVDLLSFITYNGGTTWINENIPTISNSFIDNLS
jgi:hypothetical protein